jgi:hypothetical protein
MTQAEFLIRPADAQDGAAVAEIYAHYVRETSVSFEIEPPTAAMMARRIVATLKTHPGLSRSVAVRLLATPMRAHIASDLPTAGPLRRQSMCETQPVAPGRDECSIRHCYGCCEGRVFVLLSRRSCCRTPAASVSMKR